MSSDSTKVGGKEGREEVNPSLTVTSEHVDRKYPKEWYKRVSVKGFI